jgi:uncharacterized phage protein gp47/JayE
MLPLQNFSSLVSGMAAAVQGACQQLLDLTVGSVLRAVLEANASVALWMQWLIMLVLQTTRAATSTETDLDTWVADFGVTRLPGTAANGVVTMSRWTPTLQALIPVGALARTSDGGQAFAVTTDPTNTAWSASQNGYVVPAGVASVAVPVTAEGVGIAGNVQAGTVTLLATAIPGIDTVTNAAAFSGGLDAEADAALRARFSLFIDSRNRATVIAVQNAIISVQQGLAWALTENQDPSGAARPGFFTVTLNDGTGAPPQMLLQEVATAINLVRPVGTSFAVVAPQIVTVDVSLSLQVAVGAPVSVVLANIVSAITSFINGLAIGAGLPASRLVQVAYDADPGVTNVTGLLLNGSASDLTVGPMGLLAPGTITVN